MRRKRIARAGVCVWVEEWGISVRVCACVYVCIYACIHACIDICSAYTHGYIHACMYMCIHRRSFSFLADRVIKIYRHSMFYAADEKWP